MLRAEPSRWRGFSSTSTVRLERTRSFLGVSRSSRTGKEGPEGGPMYIGLGTLVFIAVVLLIIYLVRRA
jgi:hypothetical protein